MPVRPFVVFVLAVASLTAAAARNGGQPADAARRPRIAVFAGATATILNTPPLVTSNKARLRRKLPPAAGSTSRPAMDHLVPQRLAAPVEVFVEQFSAHPLEKDAAALYGPPDGYLDTSGRFHAARQSPKDKPVYRVTLEPADGLYLLPYMAVQRDGQPWDGPCARAAAPPEECRQTFYPDASRLFEEIDRGVSGRSSRGTAGSLARRADYDFYRALPPGGYTAGLPAGERSDVGTNDIRPERYGEDFFPYTPYRRDPRLEDLAKLTNVVQRAMSTGQYDGAIWLEGSPNVAETTYWLNLLIDTTAPIAGNSSQRVHGLVGNEGDQNVLDSVDYILSRIWADESGKDELGAVLLQDEQIFNARQVEKQDARPGGYHAVGDHGGTFGDIGPPVSIWFKPTARHTWKSEVNVTRLPSAARGVTLRDGRLVQVDVPVKDAGGLLLGSAIPKVTMVKYNRYMKDTARAEPEEEVEALARIAENLEHRPLSGFVAEGMQASGGVHEPLEKALEIAAMSGMPVVRVSRGDSGAMVPTSRVNLTIEGRDLTAPKARLLLMAALMKFGSLPPAADPRKPTETEKGAVRERLELYQKVFDNH